MRGLDVNPQEPGPDAVTASASTPQHDLTSLVVPLLKGVLYREDDAAQWAALLQLQSRVRDYVAVLALELVVDEAEGYAFLRSQPQSDDSAPKLPRLVRRQPLSFQVSLLLALLRRRGAVASRLDLLREVWGHTSAVLTRTVDTHIAELRQRWRHAPDLDPQRGGGTGARFSACGLQRVAPDRPDRDPAEQGH